MRRPLLAVIDVGKTRTRLHVVEPIAGQVVWSSQRPSCTVRRGVLNELDIGEAEQWLLAELARAPERERIADIVPVAHGAAAALLDAVGNTLLVPDYEDTAFERTRAKYAQQRDPFAMTLSPQLPRGLNLGAQLHFVESDLPELWRRVAHIVPLPQYFAERLCGVMASEVTSLGAHTDLWLPREREFAPMVRRRGWDRLLAPLRRADEALGCVSPALARSTGLDPSCRVLCGIHDSNAAFLGHTMQRPADPSIALVSSGTWTIVMARGIDPERLDEGRDMLANVDAFGTPVGTIRFMGGREYAAICGEHAVGRQPDAGAVGSVVARGWMALPNFTQSGGPLPGRRGHVDGPATMSDDERAALATLYLALVVDLMLDLLGCAADCIVDGPLAHNPAFGSLLAELRPGFQVLVSRSAAGPVDGARVLAAGMRPIAPAGEATVARPLGMSGLASYRQAWRSRCTG